MKVHSWMVDSCYLMADSVEVGNFWYLEYFSIPLLLDYVINSSMTTYAEFITPFS